MDYTIEIGKTLNPIKEIIENPANSCALDYGKFIMYLSETFGKANTNEIVKQYTDNFEGLINMLDLVHQHLGDRTLKSRCTRLKKNYSNQKTP